MQINLSTSIEEIPKIGPQHQKRLKRLGIKTVRNLLFHFPHRYEDFSNLIRIGDIEESGPAFAEDSAGKPFCFQGEILDVKNIYTFRKRMVLTQMVLDDGTGKIKAIWFNQPYLINSFKKGEHVCLAGKIAKKGSARYLSNPAYEKIPKEFLTLGSKQPTPGVGLIHTGRLVPVYPETEGLSSKWLRFVVKPLLLKLKNQIRDPLPEKIRQKYGFLPLERAVWQMHFPDSLKFAEEAKKRFAFEELFNLSLFVLRERMKLIRERAIATPLNLALIREFTKSLPFKLTDAQKKSAWQILKDLEKPRPMNRLLEGDVGSGKTVVAAIAILNVAKAGYQTVFMAPTEILAKQHFKTINEFLNPASSPWGKIKIGLLTGKKKIVAEGADVLIGTHALLQEKVKFERLALVIVDEQHRFGVEQRAKLTKQPTTNPKAEPSARYGAGNQQLIPHFLSMTATPIPRTLSLTIFADLDLSIIDELPKGRKKVITKIIQPKDKKRAYEFIRQQVEAGNQVFVICPRIEPRTRTELGAEQTRQTPALSAKTDTGRQALLLDERVLSWMEVKAVKEEYEKLSKEIFPDLKIGQLHGKMKTEEKEKVMKDFKDKKIDILVATSVVEVGVDVPNATIMMIEGSEKFGLAQLHQFRGRVGRSDSQSYCFLFIDTPGIVYNRRLRALISCENGFELAEKDLAIRGPGAINGIRQWGFPDLVMASLTDVSLVEKTKNEAKKILEEDPELKKYPLLRQKLEEFRERIHLE